MYNDIYDKEQFAYLYATLCKWLQLKIDGGGLEDILHQSGVQTIALYGIGGLGEYVYQELEKGKIKIAYFIDRRYVEFVHGIDGIPVIGLQHIKEQKSVDAIIVTPVYYNRMIMEDLITQEVPVEKILSLAMLLA